MDIYGRIKQRRKFLKMSQETLAQKTGYTDRSSIARIEAGNIDLPQSKLVKIADALNTTPAFLMGWKENAIVKKIEKLDEIDLMRLNERIDTMLEAEKYKGANHVD